ncbi:Putative PRELI/MSF1 domain, Slowmo/Ups family protein [Septoria linicola]|uniref:PRELI/MSF1 domain, Slowmo/Ups family protein n=1 Tax=Septoria linicola TaxID=215465 RepID=A0A9Q9B029_9PEZI|nr:putative PRELI/MSF1 domain, Slowmo/Ups family protein [Septoria linicola]USW58235.1 Putative PRELI/MSF1 domain, Slowmo/Ups family protein [Septoria linicola]
MKIFSTNHSYDYSWDEVSTCNWRKYCPWNDKSTHVIAVDTLSRSLDASTGILRTERLITCRQSAPKWLQTFFGSSETSQVYEVSYVDPSAKKVTMCSQNLTWSDLLTVNEKVVYRPDPVQQGRTVFEQEARITALCGGWQKIKSAIEDISVERFKENAVKGREGFERVLAISREVFAEERKKRHLTAM